MAWIESHQALGHHPKTIQMAERLRVSLPCAVGYLHYLWWWALDFAQDGQIKRANSAVIARACEWRGDPERFWEALVHAGFVEADGERAWIHDWEDYAGRLIDKRRLDAERKRAARAAAVQRSSAGRRSDGARTGPDLTGPDLTGPDLTGPDLTLPPNPPSDQPKGGDRSKKMPGRLECCDGVRMLDLREIHLAGCPSQNGAIPDAVPGGAAPQ